ncbi:MAG: hypothetical protein ACFFDC_16240 [Promethearchaeota archaeon]
MSETRQYKMTGQDKIISVYMLIGAIVQVISLFFFGNWAGLDIIFFLGLGSLGISGVLFLSSNVLKKEGGMEKGKSFVTTKLVSTGIKV